MRLQISKSKNATSYYVIKSYRENGHNTSKVIEKLGTREQIMARTGCDDPEAWARAYIEELNKKEKAEQKEVLLHLEPSARIRSGEQKSFNGGYLFLQKIYHELGLHNICREISRRHSFEYNLNSILSRLLYGRILFPSSKLSTFQQSQKLLEQPDFELHDVYRALSVIAQESDFIQSELYKNSLKISKRKTGVIFYDCTNFFFETEQAGDGTLPQYGVSKEHRPNPIVQMGLFMDADGIPLAFCINPGNTNENITMAPLEKKLFSDFHLSKFVVCTDAGLASKETHMFNDLQAIKECFRIMKSEFLARPVYLSRDDRIKAHFTTCFLSLILYRYLEKKLKDQFSCNEIIDCLRDMNFLRIRGTGYIPCYTRTKLTDTLHKVFGFETDHEVITSNQMKKIYKISKK